MLSGCRGKKTDFPIMRRSVFFRGGVHGIQDQTTEQVRDESGKHNGFRDKRL